MCKECFRISTRWQIGFLFNFYKYNVQERGSQAYDLAEFFIEKAAADGSIHQCSREDLDELVDFMDLFHKETGIDQKDRDGYRMDAEAFIKTGNMFFWKDKYGNNVASCMFAPDGAEQFEFSLEVF